MRAETKSAQLRAQNLAGRNASRGQNQPYGRMGSAGYAGGGKPAAILHLSDFTIEKLPGIVVTQFPAAFFDIIFRYGQPHSLWQTRAGLLKHLFAGPSGLFELSSAMAKKSRFGSSRQFGPLRAAGDGTRCTPARQRRYYQATTCVHPASAV